MILTKVFPTPTLSIDTEAPGGREKLLELYRPPQRDWLRLNLIASVNGQAAGSDGTSETLTSAADRTILGVIRELSDVVLVGARSVRKEGYLLPRVARLAVVTSTGDLGGHRVGPSPDRKPLIVLCPPTAVERVRNALGEQEVEIIPLAPDNGTGLLGAAEIIEALRVRGWASIVCEGGPQLIGQLLSAGLVDEACFSTSPIIGGTDLAMVAAPTQAGYPVKLGQLIVDGSSGIYARWRIGEPSSL